ncbi:hypothetical protein E2C01_074866 [Portunus trituberculatus]|nr:hypothetical protein [Portunus trituberculatus]
MPYRVI